MKITGKIKNPKIHKFYATGSLEQKVENVALQKMLSKIKNGGMNAFLNDENLGKFAKGMRESFISEGLLNKDNSLAASGEDVVKTGKSWKGLEGAFWLTVFEYNGEFYILDSELAGSQKGNNRTEKESEAEFQNRIKTPQFSDKEYKNADGTFVKNIKLDSFWAKSKNHLSKLSVKFSFDYKSEKCNVEVFWNDAGKDKKVSFETTEESKFTIIKNNEAMQLLEECERHESVFDFSVQDKISIQIRVSDSKQLLGKTWLQSCFETGTFCFQNISLNKDGDVCKIENICAYINQDDKNSTNILLNEFLLKKAESSYLGYEEVGRLVNEFQNLFTSPNGKIPACPPIMESNKEIYNLLVEQAKEISKTNPLAYLHLQAFIDLVPEDTIKPYIEKEAVVNLSNQEISFPDLVQKVFGNERTIKSISLISKYTASNGRNARAVELFAKSVEKQFGAKTFLITTSETKPNEKYAESNKFWFDKMRKSLGNVIEKKADEIKKIHDRYYKVVRTDGKTEWWILSGELDSLRFENDAPKLREDIDISTKGRVKEMTFSKIKKSGVLEQVINLMGETK